jgi:hypothetical protein
MGMNQIPGLRCGKSYGNRSQCHCAESGQQGLMRRGSMKPLERCRFSDCLILPCFSLLVNIAWLQVQARRPSDLINPGMRRVTDSQ